MMLKIRTHPHFKLFFLTLWLTFTSAMVIWWWVHAITDFKTATDNFEDALKNDRMIMWEGSAFLMAIFVAAYSLWIFIKRDVLRHNQLKMFFNSFSHDIKTSITRLRLQSEVLQDQKALAGDEKLRQLIRDISRLDLQLENSLYISQEGNFQIYTEKLQLSDIIQNIKSDFSEIEIYLAKDATIRADRRLFLCVLRNIISNSVLHGAATEIKFAVNIQREFIELQVNDNGQGAASDATAGSDTKGFGIGNDICKQLLQKMHGQFTVTSTAPQYSVSIRIPGATP